MTGVMFATRREAKPFLRLVDAQEIRGTEIPFYRCGRPEFADYAVCICGIGPCLLGDREIPPGKPKGRRQLASPGEIPFRLIPCFHREEGDPGGRVACVFPT